MDCLRIKKKVNEFNVVIRSIYTNLQEFEGIDKKMDYVGPIILIIFFSIMAWELVLNA